MVRLIPIMAVALCATTAGAADFTPDNQALTPTAAPGAIFQPLNPDLPADPKFTAGQAAASALSPDGKTLLILTSGFNRTYGPTGPMIADRSNEYVFVYDVTGAAPVKRQVIQAPNTFLGIAWASAGDRFFISGGVDDDVLEFVSAGGTYQAGRIFKLGHKAGLGLSVKPEAAGVAVSPDGKRLLVANLQNDSVSMIDLATGAVREQDLRPGKLDKGLKGLPGGTFPRAVVWVSDTKAYVASERDREIIPLRIGPEGIGLGRRQPTRGQPVALLAGPNGRLFAALDNTDGVAVIDTASDRLLETIPTGSLASWGKSGLGGAGSNGLALSPDNGSLLVSNGGENAVAVVKLDPVAMGRASAGPSDGDDKPIGSRVVGMIPTGWYPTAVTVSRDGREIFIVNGKSIPGPNRGGCRATLSIKGSDSIPCKSANQYVWQLEKAGFLTLPTPSATTLGALTRQVAVNNRVFAAPSADDARTMAFLRGHIHHVIYIVKENRTYDQVLGDLEVGNGDPKLAIFCRAITPNLHALARRFVDLDAFFDSGESSNTGWNWSTAARTTDFTEREAPVNYAGRGLQYDQEGDNRNINVAFATSAERRSVNPLGPDDPDMLPGVRDVAAPDGPDGAAGLGYIWDSAMRAGLSVRNWGFYGDLALYERDAGSARTPKLREPWLTKTAVFTPAKASLMSVTDPYFRGFDQGFPDYWRFKEWEREYDGFARAGAAPNLMLVRLAHDHTGDFADGIDGINTVEAELADNDYAVGRLIEKVAHGPFAKDTLIFVVEDDAQDGPDHVDAHRSIAFVAGPYVKQGAVVSHRYTTVDMVRTIETVLGLLPMGLNDALAEPMAAVFNTSQADWTYDAIVPGVLRQTALPLPPPGETRTSCAVPTRSSAYWAAAMKGQNFSSEDRLDTARFNLALWRGMKGYEPYPVARDGRNLSAGRLAARAACD